MVKLHIDLDGVKIPKKLRKQGKKLIEKANSPQGREVIAAGLAIAGSAIAARARAKAARGADAGEAAAERAAERAARAGDRAAAAGERVRAKVIRHPSAQPSAPGEPGIDPGNDLNEAISAGVAALQNFLAGTKR